MLQWLPAVSNTVAKLIGPEFEPQITCGRTSKLQQLISTNNLTLLKETAYFDQKFMVVVQQHSSLLWIDSI